MNAKKKPKNWVRPLVISAVILTMGFVSGIGAREAEAYTPPKPTATVTPAPTPTPTPTPTPKPNSTTNSTTTSTTTSTSTSAPTSMSAKTSKPDPVPTIAPIDPEAVTGDASDNDSENAKGEAGADASVTAPPIEAVEETLEDTADNDTASNASGRTQAVRNPYDKSLFVKKGTIMYYEELGKYTSRRGIDVSSFSGDIDWSKVKSAGYEFAFIRLGFRGYGSRGSLNLDPSFEINLKGAKKAGLEVGVYFFSQAVNEKEAVEEAEYVLKHLDGEKLDLEVVFDPEDVPDTSARTRNVTGAQFTRNAIAFCETIREAGYEPAVYGNLKWMTSVLDMVKLSDYPVWYAQYSLKPQSPYTFRYWQYSSTGHVHGVEGDVDLNIELIPCDGESEE